MMLMWQLKLMWCVVYVVNDADVVAEVDVVCDLFTC